MHYNMYFKIYIFLIVFLLFLVFVDTFWTWGIPSAPPSPASMSKFPSGGKIWKMMFLDSFLDCEPKLRKRYYFFENMHVLRTSNG